MKYSIVIFIESEVDLYQAEELLTRLVKDVGMRSKDIHVDMRMMHFVDSKDFDPGKYIFDLKRRIAARWDMSLRDIENSIEVKKMLKSGQLKKVYAKNYDNTRTIKKS